MMVNYGSNGSMGDKEYLNDSLISQKQMTSTYNTYAGECVNQQLRCDLLTLLDEEHQIQADLFTQMTNHGWYQVESAEQQKVNQARQKFVGQ